MGFKSLHKAKNRLEETVKNKYKLHLTCKLGHKRNVEKAKLKLNWNLLPLRSAAGEVDSVLEGDPGIH